MAMMELRMLLAAMVLHFTWTGAPEKEGCWDEEMRPVDGIVIHPYSRKCFVNIEPVGVRVC